MNDTELLGVAFLAASALALHITISRAGYPAPPEVATAMLTGMTLVAGAALLFLGHVVGGDA